MPLISCLHAGSRLSCSSLFFSPSCLLVVPHSPSFRWGHLSWFPRCLIIKQQYARGQFPLYQYSSPISRAISGDMGEAYHAAWALIVVHVPSSGHLCDSWSLKKNLGVDFGWGRALGNHYDHTVKPNLSDVWTFVSQWSCFYFSIRISWQGVKTHYKQGLNWQNLHLS